MQEGSVFFFLNSTQGSRKQDQLHTSAELLSRPTTALVTPGSLFKLFSIAVEHDEQVMPPMATCKDQNKSADS